jgi:hypothetical protein
MTVRRGARIEDGAAQRTAPALPFPAVLTAKAVVWCYPADLSERLAQPKTPDFVGQGNEFVTRTPHRLSTEAGFFFSFEIS